MLGIIGDEITESSQIGLQIANWNYTTELLAYEGIDEIEDSLGDVIIIDTNSRFDKRDMAYEKVRKATRKLHERGVTQFLRKTGSPYLGNIGVELDAMQDELGIYFSLLIPGYLETGVRDFHPILQDHLIQVLEKQTERKIGSIQSERIRQGSSSLHEEIERMKKEYNYVILDVDSSESMKIAAEVIQHYPILYASASIDFYLPAFWPKKEKRQLIIPEDYQEALGTLIVNGSLMPRMNEQIEPLIRQGAADLTIQTEQLFTKEGYEWVIHQASLDCKEWLKKGKKVILRPPYSPERIKATRNNGKRHMGLDGVSSSKWVSKALAEITFRVVQELGLKKLLMAGGNTSNAICSGLGIKRFLIGEEVIRGLPSCIVDQERPFMIILKAGNFGEEDCLLRIVEYLKKFDAK